MVYGPGMVYCRGKVRDLGYPKVSPKEIWNSALIIGLCKKETMNIQQGVLLTMRPFRQIHTTRT